MEFAWDPDKAASNEEKHGVSFEAATAFGDPLSLMIPDPDRSDDEERFVLLGESYAGRLLMVVHTDREERFGSSALDWLPGRETPVEERRQY
jgi:uncharacterized DUF497 family protein